MLVEVVQVNDYFFAGSPDLAAVFEAFFHKQCKIGFSEQSSHNILGARFTKGAQGAIVINVKEKLIGINPLKTIKTCKNKDDAAPGDELTDFRSTAGKLLYTGRLVSLTTAYHAFHIAEEVLVFEKIT